MSKLLKCFHIPSHIFLIFLVSCSAGTQENPLSGRISGDTSLPQNEFIDAKKVTEKPKGVPEDGTYRYDIAFAEWEGKSMGEEVLVEIAGDSIRVIYDGNGHLSLTVPGETLETGVIRKHKSGVWIIAQSESDVEIDEIGGCTGGPTIIDFENKKYWLC